MLSPIRFRHSITRSKNLRGPQKKSRQFWKVRLFNDFIMSAHDLLDFADCLLGGVLLNTGISFDEKKKTLVSYVEVPSFAAL